MISPARSVSLKLLSEIESRHVFSDDALNSEDMERLEIRDRHLTTQIVYGTLRWQGTLDYLLSEVSSMPWQKVEPAARILLRMSVYQMWHMNRIPDHAIVNDAVELAKRGLGKGIDRYVNGILRGFSRTRPWKNGEFLARAPSWVRASLPEWLWERWVSRFGEGVAAEFATSLNNPPLTAIRMGEEGIESIVSPSDLVPGAGILTGAIPKLSGGLQWQDEASQLIPHLMGPVSGWRLWDACAAPGGKTAILEALAGETGCVVASDLRHERASRMAGLLKGHARPLLLVADASKPAPFRCRFDGVLADVPCSGLGTLRRNPEIRWHFRPDTLPLLQRTQQKILESVSSTVRLGGRMLYSTCSTEPEENEEVVLAFLASHPEYCLVRPELPPGIERWTGHDGMVRTFPGTRLWDGFFAALMVHQ